jgi:YidC/Oxa1 family membrane protein insertase
VDRNFFLAFALSFLVLVVWSMLQTDQQERFPQGSEPSSAPAVQRQIPGEVPVTAREAEPVPRPAKPLMASSPTERQPLAEARTVTIETDLYRAELTSRGGALLKWELDRYRDAQQPGDPPVDLTTLERGEASLATSLEGLGWGDLSAAAYEVERPSQWEVAFRKDLEGLRVRKLYSFDPDSYLFRLLIEVSNQSSKPVEPGFELTWVVRSREATDFTNQMLVALDQGSVDRTPVESIGQPGFMSRLLGGGGDSDGPLTFSNEVDWAGAETQYFLSVMLPDVPRDARAVFMPLQDGGGATAQIGYAPTLLAPGQELAREYRVYIGPKETERLEAIGAQLDRSIDRGWAWVAPLTALFSWLLRATYALVPNYGVDIILITIGVRLLTAPLMSKQMRSMRKMGELQPKMKELQAKHGDDRQRQSEEMMKLYKQSGVNPLGGCFPMLLQLPVFIGLYYALQSSIELRQAPFMLWINDLSVPETLFMIPGLDLPVRVLPLLMGASMVFQQRLTPTTIDPAQARMMMTVMPVMFTVLFYRFPSGLVLYWFVSNLLGIVHQLWVNRGKPKPPAPKAPSNTSQERSAKGKQRSRR